MFPLGDGRVLPRVIVNSSWLTCATSHAAHTDAASSGYRWHRPTPRCSTTRRLGAILEVVLSLAWVRSIDVVSRRAAERWPLGSSRSGAGSSRLRRTSLCRYAPRVRLHPDARGRTPLKDATDYRLLIRQPCAVE
jgi:hypothetical protein